MNNTVSDQHLFAMATELGSLLKQRHYFFATAESCTGGWVAKLMTDVVGSSGWFDRGFVTYTNQSKQDLLGVPVSTLEKYGAVSEATVQAMARGALLHSQADISVAVSGIAGPSGGTPFKPVGTVWFAWGYKEANAVEVFSHHRVFSGDRDSVRRQAVVHAMEGVIERLHDQSNGKS